MRDQWREIERLRAKTGRVDIMRSTEVDIRRDGTLDFDDDLLAEFDCVIAAVHTSFTLSSPEMTERVIAAVSNPCVDVLAHPTGRLLLSREPYAIDVEKVVAACAANGVAIEIDGHPSRLDLDWRFVRAGKELGARFVVSLDAHTAEDFANLPYGVSNARKGWLEKSDVLNCLAAGAFRKWVAERRAAAKGRGAAKGNRASSKATKTRGAGPRKRAASSGRISRRGSRG